MHTVLELIERLKKEDPNAIVLVDGYEYGMEYLRFKNLEKGKFMLPEDSDITGYGGSIEPDNKGDFNFLLIGRHT